MVHIVHQQRGAWSRPLRLAVDRENPSSSGLQAHQDNERRSVKKDEVPKIP